eukprot:scaffold248375_cov71-Cyclotella_meneghiniana.AAC.3
MPMLTLEYPADRHSVQCGMFFVISYHKGATLLLTRRSQSRPERYHTLCDVYVGCTAVVL